VTPIVDSVALSGIAFETNWTGEPLPLEDVLVRTGWSQPRQQAAVEQLLDAGRLELDGAQIIGAHGVTLRPTTHRVLHDGATTHTWCAFDAVGIPTALGIDASVITSCPNCGARLELAIHKGLPEDRPLLAWMPFGPCEHVMREFCPAANLFCSRDHVEEWRKRANSPDGAALTLVEIAEHGRRAWADVAASHHSDRAGKESHG
jgi:Alkylmercury lyase